MYNIDSVLRWFYSSAWLAGVASIFYLIYLTLRKRIYVTVNCWFCNTDSKVPFSNKKEWCCANCQQFNGFNEDGDYSKPIPEQYENLNHKYFAKSKSSRFKNSNGLCRICNANQELKIKQLAAYEPFREKNYDREIEAFRQRLEKSYKLCSICERTVKNTLKLKSEFLPKVSSQFASDFIIESVDHSRKLIFLFTILGFTCVVVIILHIVLNEIMTLEDQTFPTNFINVRNIYYTDAHEIFEDENVLNVALALCLTLFAKNVRGWRALRCVCLTILTFVAGHYLNSSFKVAAIFILVVLWSISFWRIRFKKQLQIRNKHLELFDDNDVDVTFRKSNSQSTRNTIPNPLCGPFSGLNLGQSEITYGVTTKHASYLFKPTKPLIQPARLKIDDTDWSDTARSTPTISSGYDSVTSFLNRSPDSISEFDSVSQVDRNDSKNLSSESRWRKSRIRANDYQNLHNDTSSPNIIVPYEKPLDDRYYGVSSRCSPNCSNSSSSSRVQVDYFCSTVQIMLFSSAFFILGFSLQTFIAKLQS